MSSQNALRDENRVPSLLGEANDGSGETRRLQVDASTGRLKVAATGGGGGSITVKDGSTTVNSVTTIDFTSGATVTNGGGGTANVAVSGGSSGLTVGTTTITSGTDTRVLFDNAGVLGEYAISGTGSVAMTTSPSFTTPSLGVATATSLNGLTVTSSTGTLTIANGKTLTASNTLTFTGTDGSSVAFGAGGTVLYSASTIPLTVGSTTIASGTTTRILYDNAGVLGEYAISGTGSVAMTNSPSFTTPTLGVASATSINKVAITAPATSATLTIADGKTLTASNSLTLAGTDSTTMTFPSTSASIARTDAAQTFTGVQSMTSPDITTSLTSPSATFSLLNVTPTTINFGGAATTINMGGSGAAINLGGGASAAELRFLEPSGSGTNYTAFKAAAQAGNVTYTLPTADGTSGYVLSTNGSGTLSWAAAGGGSASPAAPLGQIPLTGMKYVKAFGSNLSTGNNDIYTCPTGKKAYISQGQHYNQSGGNIGVYVQLKSGGNYYRLIDTVTVSTLTSGAFTTAGTNIVLDAGESISVNTATNNGLNVWFRVVEFDDTVKFFTKKVLNPASGDNTVYTVPASTGAKIVTGFGDVSTSSLFYTNDSGGSRTVYWNIVPSGGSPGATNKATTSNSVSAAAGSFPNTTIGCLDAGDFVSFNTNASTTTQIAWINVMEYPA